MMMFKGVRFVAAADGGSSGRCIISGRHGTTNKTTEQHTMVAVGIGMADGRRDSVQLASDVLVVLWQMMATTTCTIQ